MRFLGGPGFGPDDLYGISRDDKETFYIKNKVGYVRCYTRRPYCMRNSLLKDFHRAFIRIPARNSMVTGEIATELGLQPLIRLTNECRK